MKSKPKEKKQPQGLLQQSLPKITGKSKTIKPHQDAAMDAHDGNQGKLLDSSELGDTLLG